MFPSWKQTTPKCEDMDQVLFKTFINFHNNHLKNHI